MPIYKIDGEKKDGLQKYRIVINYTDRAGEKRTVERREYGKAQAERLEAKLKEEIKKKAWENPMAGMTISELIDLYAKEHGPDIRATTLDKKKSILKNGARHIWAIKSSQRCPKTISRDGGRGSTRKRLPTARRCGQQRKTPLTAN